MTDKVHPEGDFVVRKRQALWREARWEVWDTDVEAAICYCPEELGAVAIASALNFVMATQKKRGAAGRLERFVETNDVEVLLEGLDEEVN